MRRESRRRASPHECAASAQPGRSWEGHCRRSTPRTLVEEARGIGDLRDEQQARTGERAPERQVAERVSHEIDIESRGLDRDLARPARREELVIVDGGATVPKVLSDESA